MEINETLKKYNFIYYQTDNIYRLINKKLNIPFSYYQILYLLRCDTCLPYGQEIVKATGEPKQTINSALKKLEKDGLIQLTKEENKKVKKIVLTKMGEDYCKSTIDQIIQAEINALNSINKNDLKIFLDVGEKLKNITEMEFSKIHG